MTRGQAIALHGSTALAGGTGLVYAWMRYFCASDDPFAVVNHPLQPFVQHAHVVVSPLLVFASGWIWEAHVWPRIRSRFTSRRKSGVSLAVSLLPMVLSGYMIQVSTDEGARRVWIAAHLASSAAWLVAYLVHQTRRVVGARDARDTGARGGSMRAAKDRARALSGARAATARDQGARSRAT